MDDSIFEDVNDNLLGAIVRYRNHPSIFAIMKFCNSKSHFLSKNVQKEEILKEINNLTLIKHHKTLIFQLRKKRKTDIFKDFIFSNLNCCTNTSLYASLMKRSNITPVHKKESKNVKSNYRPVSILSNIPKLYERFVFKQMSKCFESFFSKY